jgi:hypothetical protein
MNCSKGSLATSLSLCRLDKAKAAREQLKVQIYQANPNSAPSRASVLKMQIKALWQTTLLTRRRMMMTTTTSK